MNKLLKCIPILVTALLVSPAALATLAVVQAAAANSGGGNFSAYQPFSGTQPAVGHGLIIEVTVQEISPPTGASVTITDNQTGNTYTLAKSSAAAPVSSADAQIFTFYCQSLASVSGNLTLNGTATGGNIFAIGVIEANGPIVPDQANAPASSTTSGTSLTVTNGAANTSAVEVVVAGQRTSPDSGTNGLSGPTSGYTSLYLHDAANDHDAIDYKVTSAIETSAASWASTSSTWFAGSVVTFKSPSAGGTSKSQGFF